MSSKLRRTVRYTRRTIGYGLLILLILAALAVSVANLLLPFVEDNPVRVKAWLSEQIGQPVDYSRSQTEWTHRGPRVRLTGLKVGKGAAMVEIAQAELLVSVYSGLLPNHPLTELKVRNLHLSMVQQTDESWKLLGVPRQADSKQDALDVLSGFGELQIEDSEFRIIPRARNPLLIPRVDLRLRVKNKRLNVGIRAEAKRGDTPLFAVIDFTRPDMSGKLWLGGERLHINQWLALFPDIDVAAIQSETTLDVWADIEKRRIMRAHGKVKIEDLNQIGDDLADAGKVNHRLFDSIIGEWRWQRNDNGWISTIPEIKFNSNNGGSHAIRDVRISQQADRWRAQASSIAIQPLVSLVTLDKKLAAGSNLSWLGQSGLRGQLQRLTAHGESKNLKWHVSGISKSLGFNAVANSPGIEGLGGPFIADQDGGVIRIDADKSVLDWPVAYGRRIDSQLNGAVSWWRSGPAWEFGSHSLQWQGDGLALDIDAQMRFAANSKAPDLNLSAKLKPFNFATAKKFWLQHLMSKASMDWLNMALVKGQVRDASVLVAGNLADWPFAARTGRFSAKATVLADTLKFTEDWPAADNAVLFADFNGPGFSAIGHTDFLGNRIELKPSGIAQFSVSDLIIDAHADSDFARLMPVLQKTPLKDVVGTTVTGLKGKGPVAADVRMLFPLAKGMAFNQIGGSINFKGTDIRMPEWNLGMQSVFGSSRFDNDGFIAENLKGKMAKLPVNLGLRVGSGHVLSKINQVESEISGPFHTDTLLAFDPSLKDLKSILKGSSQWRFGVTVPALRNSAAAPVQLTAVSDLVGTAISLPVPLKKLPADSRQFSLNTLLPLGQGPVDIRVGPDFRLLLNKPEKKPIAAVALFGKQTQGAIPSSGISVRGTTSEFDVPGWISLAKHAEGEGGLQSLDLIVENFRLASADFGEVRLQRVASSESMTIRAIGSNLNGSLSVPDKSSEPITARFSTVHMMPTNVGKNATAADTPLDLGNPAEIPPIDLQITDLRVGKMLFGRVDLLTSPVSNGLLIKRLSTQSPLLTMAATGAWQGTAAQSGTAFNAQLSSPDLGRFLDASGYVDVFDRGTASAKLNGAWPGSPLDFSLRSLKGNLDFTIKNGQIPSIKAGGGRVLGLLSIAELKRRLTMDFSDFTGEGLGFNSIQGQFQFAQGKATTQNTQIKAPSADISFSGSTDLVLEQFDQTVVVQPNTGGFLPVIGAVAGGPIGAAAGLAAQAVLGKGLQKGITLKYRITGPWAKPDVQKLQDAGKKPVAEKPAEAISPPN
jgi:uncharacterized protein (TIGR02099 family)